MATETVNITTTLADDSVTNAKLAEMNARTIKLRATGTGLGNPIDGSPDQASEILDFATDPFVRTSALPPGGGDVVGPASSVDANIALFDGITGKLIQDAGINLSEIIEEDPGPGVGLIESGAGVSPIVLKNLKNGAGTKVTNNTGSVQVDIDFTAADRYYYSDGSALPVEGTITSAGRDLLDDANAAAQRTTLGLGTAATANTGDFDAAGAAAAAQAAAIAASQPLDAALTAYANAADASARRALIGAGTGNGDALVANPLSQFAATTSAQLAGVISDEMAGTGTKLAFGTSGVEAAYTGTPTYTGGTPSGASSLTQLYTQVGNLVTFQIQLTYATGGTTMTNFSLTFPTEFPTPHIPTGFTGASVRLYPLNGRILTTPTGTPVSVGVQIARNAANTAFEIITTSGFGSATVRNFIINGSYFTA